MGFLGISNFEFSNFRDGLLLVFRYPLEEFYGILRFQGWKSRILFPQRFFFFCWGWKGSISIPSSEEWKWKYTTLENGKVEWIIKYSILFFFQENQEGSFRLSNENRIVISLLKERKDRLIFFFLYEKWQRIDLSNN